MFIEVVHLQFKHHACWWGTRQQNVLCSYLVTEPHKCLCADKSIDVWCARRYWGNWSVVHSRLKEIWGCCPVKWLYKRGPKKSLPGLLTWKEGIKSVEEAECCDIITLQDNCKLYLDFIFFCRRVIKISLLFLLLGTEIFASCLLKKDTAFSPHLNIWIPLVIVSCTIVGEHPKIKILYKQLLSASGTEVAQLSVSVLQAFVALGGGNFHL